MGRRLSGSFSLPFAVVLSVLTPSFAHATCSQRNIVNAGATADATTGEILSSHGNIDAEFNPASLTKIVSTLVVLEAVRNGQLSLSQQMIIAPAQDGYNGDKLLAGTNITLENALRASSASQNGIYIAMARAYPGGESAFMRRMNEIVQLAGAEHTHFINPNGLFLFNVSQNCAGHHTTIRDLFRILHYAQREYPNEMRQYFGQSHIEYNNTDPYASLLPSLNPTSALLADREQIFIRDGIDIRFVKTGFIGYSGAHIFANAMIYGHSVYGIETGVAQGPSADNKWYRIRDMELLNAFRNIRGEFIAMSFATNNDQQPTPTASPYTVPIHVSFSYVNAVTNGGLQRTAIPRPPRDNFLSLSLRPLTSSQVAEANMSPSPAPSPSPSPSPVTSSM